MAARTHAFIVLMVLLMLLPVVSGLTSIDQDCPDYCLKRTQHTNGYFNKYLNKCVYDDAYCALGCDSGGISCVQEACPDFCDRGIVYSQGRQEKIDAETERCAYVESTCPFGCLAGTARCAPKPDCSQDYCGDGLLRREGYFDDVLNRCVYVEERCVWGCGVGACAEPPVCPSYCERGTLFREGFADDSTGACSYIEERCSWGCDAAACAPAPDCPTFCEGEVLHREGFADEVTSACAYIDEVCMWGCSGGSCVDPPDCPGYCEGDVLHREGYADDNTGRCAYVDEECDFGCNSTTLGCIEPEDPQKGVISEVLDFIAAVLGFDSGKAKQEIPAAANLIVADIKTIPAKPMRYEDFEVEVSIKNVGDAPSVPNGTPASVVYFSRFLLADAIIDYRKTDLANVYGMSEADILSGKFRNNLTQRLLRGGIFWKNLIRLDGLPSVFGGGRFYTVIIPIAYGDTEPKNIHSYLLHPFNAFELKNGLASAIAPGDTRKVRFILPGNMYASGYPVNFTVAVNRLGYLSERTTADNNKTFTFVVGDPARKPGADLSPVVCRVSGGKDGIFDISVTVANKGVEPASIPISTLIFRPVFRENNSYYYPLETRTNRVSDYQGSSIIAGLGPRGRGISRYIPPGEFATYSEQAYLTRPYVGIMKFNISLDPWHMVSDSNLTNNEVSCSVFVNSTLTGVYANSEHRQQAAFMEGSGDGVWDLSVFSMVFTRHPSALNRSLEIKTTIYNGGTLPLALDDFGARGEVRVILEVGNLSSTLTLDPESITSSDFSNILAPGGFAQATFVFGDLYPVLTEGKTYALRVSVDPYNVVPETDEGNNLFIKDYLVLPFDAQKTNASGSRSNVSPVATPPRSPPQNNQMQLSGDLHPTDCSVVSFPYGTFIALNVSNRGAYPVRLPPGAVPFALSDAALSQNLSYTIPVVSQQIPSRIWEVQPSAQVEFRAFVTGFSNTTYRLRAALDPAEAFVDSERGNNAIYCPQISYYVQNGTQNQSPSNSLQLVRSSGPDIAIEKLYTLPSIASAQNDFVIVALVRPLDGLSMPQLHPSTIVGNANGKPIVALNESGGNRLKIDMALPSQGFNLSSTAYFVVPFEVYSKNRSFNFTVTLDPYQQIKDVDRSNNARTIEVMVSDAPSSTADLVPVSCKVSALGGLISMLIDVKNNGTSDVVLPRGVAPIRIVPLSSKPKSISVDTIPMSDLLHSTIVVPGGTASFSAKISALPGGHVFRAELDPDGRFAENDRGNNAISCPPILVK